MYVGRYRCDDIWDDMSLSSHVYRVTWHVYRVTCSCDVGAHAGAQIPTPSGRRRAMPAPTSSLRSIRPSVAMSASLRSLSLSPSLSVCVHVWVSGWVGVGVGLGVCVIVGVIVGVSAGCCGCGCGCELFVKLSARRCWLSVSMHL